MEAAICVVRPLFVAVALTVPESTKVPAHVVDVVPVAAVTVPWPSILFENLTYLRARKNPELTQPAPQPASQKLRCESAA